MPVNPLGIVWPRGERLGLGPPSYLSRAGKQQFMQDLFDRRMTYLDGLPVLTNNQKMEERIRQAGNLRSKIRKLMARPKLSAREERRRQELERRAAAREDSDQEDPPGTRPPSPNPPVYLNPIQYEAVTQEQLTNGDTKRLAHDVLGVQLALEPAFEAHKAVGKIPGIPNDPTDTRSTLEVANNTQNTFSIWSALAMTLDDTERRYSRWPEVKANIIKYYVRVLNDFSHPRHRVYHILQARSELYDEKPNLLEFILNHDNTQKPWSMDPGLWQVIADFYDVEVLVVRSKQAIQPGYAYPVIYSEFDDPMMATVPFFVVARGRPIPVARQQIMLFFTINPTPVPVPWRAPESEQAWPVVLNQPYDTHRRLTFGGTDFQNRVDDMPWRSRNHSDPTKQRLRPLRDIPEQRTENSADIVERMRLVMMEEDLNYIRLKSELRWKKIRKMEHMNTWTDEIRPHRDGPQFDLLIQGAFYN